MLYETGVCEYAMNSTAQSKEFLVWFVLTWNEHTLEAYPKEYLLIATDGSKGVR